MTSFVNAVAAIVTHTPIWVWPLYALLLFLGLQRTRDSVVPLWRMLILPAVASLLLILSFVSAAPGALPAMLLGLVAGGAAGWHLEDGRASLRLPNGRIWLRGEWLSFAQLVAVLLFRYAAAVVTAMNPGLGATPARQLGTAFTSVILSAMFLGRAAARLRNYSVAWIA